MRILVLLLLISSFYPVSNEIVLEIEIVNNSSLSFQEGELYIPSLDIRQKITETQNYINIPKPGRYEFIFSSKDFIGSIEGSKRITKKTKVLRLVLYPKNGMNMPNIKLQEIPDGTEGEEFITREIENRNIYFVAESSYNSVNNETLATFENLYGIRFVFSNCYMDPISFEKAKENNTRIGDYLTKKYGEDWIEKLPAKLCAL